MTGKDLIKWIRHNNAEDLDVIVAYPGDAMTWWDGELVNNPVLASYKPGSEANKVKIVFRYGENPNCIVF